MKKNLTFSILLFIAFITHTYAQQPDWRLLKETEGVRVEYQIRNHQQNQSEYYVLRVKNTNSHDVAVNWDYRLKYNNGTEIYDPKSGEHHVGLIIKAGQHTEGYLPTAKEGSFLALHYRFTGQRGKIVPTALTNITLEFFKVFIL
ncbi:hypothetical protein [Bernardetia sp.]|uniref:hypothetical protein n=1 Tax=Bernardetia sp. TaxID=1937974 RepID=UPI0025C404B7|nr:hypothetical protein [Bernardetia sp.]